MQKADAPDSKGPLLAEITRLNNSLKLAQHTQAALIQQRNDAHNQVAFMAATVAMLKEQVAELEQRLIDSKNE